MEHQSVAPRASHLGRLPPELIRAILMYSSDLASLRYAILSCRVLLNSFAADPSVIATRVLFNELDARDVRPEAMAALLASELVKPTRSSAQDFFRARFQERDAESGIRLTIDQVTHLSRLHQAISRLAEDFTTVMCPHLVTKSEHDNASPPQPLPLEPSTLERHRIMRTLYLLEVFFGVFRQTAMPDEELGQSMLDFPLYFAHWEIEQMACMQEFLFFQVSPSFNEMAAHDVAWGRFQVNPALWFGKPQLQSVYFEGLVTLQSLSTAKTYDEHYRLFGGGRIPKTRARNIYRALKESNHEAHSSDHRASVSGFDDARDYARKVRRPYFNDPDGGPFSIWKWAHESVLLRYSVYHRRQSKLRKWGYVIWDRARLDTLAVCRDRWQQSEVDSFRLSPPDGPAGEVDESWELSWRERSRIYNEGGRGWWAAGDESKIVWTRDKDGPEDEDGLARNGAAKTDAIPVSLDEARRAILALKRP